MIFLISRLQFLLGLRFNYWHLEKFTKGYNSIYIFLAIMNSLNIINSNQNFEILNHKLNTFETFFFQNISFIVKYIFNPSIK